MEKVIRGVLAVIPLFVIVVGGLLPEDVAAADEDQLGEEGQTVLRRPDELITAIRFKEAERRVVVGVRRAFLCAAVPKGSNVDDGFDASLSWRTCESEPVVGHLVVFRTWNGEPQNLRTDSSGRVGVTVTDDLLTLPFLAEEAWATVTVEQMGPKAINPPASVFFRAVALSGSAEYCRRFHDRFPDAKEWTELAETCKGLTGSIAVEAAPDQAARDSASAEGLNTPEEEPAHTGRLEEAAAAIKTEDSTRAGLMKVQKKNGRKVPSYDGITLGMTKAEVGRLRNLQCQPKLKAGQACSFIPVGIESAQPNEPLVVFIGGRLRHFTIDLNFRSAGDREFADLVASLKADLGAAPEESSNVLGRFAVWVSNGTRLIVSWSTGCVGIWVMQEKYGGAVDRLQMEYEQSDGVESTAITATPGRPSRAASPGREAVEPTSGASGNRDGEGADELVKCVRLNEKMQMVISVQRRIHPCDAAWNKGPLKKGQKFLPLERAFEHRKGPVPAPWPTHHTRSVGGKLVWFYSQDTGDVLAPRSDILPGIFMAACGELDQADLKRWRGWGVRNPAFICELETQTRELTEVAERRAILNVQLVLDKNMAVLGAMDSTNAEALSPESYKRCKLSQGK